MRAPRGIAADPADVTSQAQTAEVADRLKKIGMDAKIYHAGMSNDDRKLVQDAFMKSTGEMVVVATIAFGMGPSASTRVGLTAQASTSRISARSVRPMHSSLIKMSDRPHVHAQVDRGLLAGDRARRS